MNFTKPLSVTPDFTKKPGLHYKNMSLSPFSLLRKKLLRHYISNRDSTIASIPSSPGLFSNTKRKICIKSILESTQKTQELKSYPYKIALKISINKENWNTSLTNSVEMKSKHIAYYKNSHKLNPLSSAFSKKIREKYPLLVRGSHIYNE